MDVFALTAENVSAFYPLLPEDVREPNTEEGIVLLGAAAPDEAGSLRACGTAVLQMVDEDTWFVTWLLVAPEYRGQGAGTGLLALAAEIADAMRCNFEGYEALREKLLKAPKYGNNDPFVDKYAIWFTKRLSELFMQYKTRDGGGFYSALAANTSNIHAGRSIGATPDGRLAGTPLSDAASPTYGRDTKGPTAAILSLSKPDYTYCACGSVISQINIS